ncbi:fatty acid--CoA ligase [Streptomyces purpurascens]
MVPGAAADYKLPRVIRLLETLPRTSNGKLLRQAAALRAAASGAS